MSEPAVKHFAIAYARRGMAVLPLHAVVDGWCTCGTSECPSPGKHPRTEHGLKDATCDPNIIAAWWGQWPDSNLGIVTGSTSGLAVLDVDGEDGERSLAILQARFGSLPVTLEARTGKGRHLYFKEPEGGVRNSAGKLGPGLDIRGEGGYVVAPRSLHPSGKRYRWLNRNQPAELPSWFVELLREPRPASSNGSGEKVQAGMRNAHLTSLAGSMRRRGMSEAAIAQALLTENRERCEPSLPEQEVRAIAKSISRYEPNAVARRGTDNVVAGEKGQSANPWSAAQEAPTFLVAGTDEVDFLEPRLLAPGAITELFSPRGIGKTQVGLALAVKLAHSGKRILLLDRDNPPSEVRKRLRSWGASQTPTLKVLTRDKVPRLMDLASWVQFPIGDYDVVILDSLDSAAEGMGEQDSAKPSRAISPLLDIAHCERGPALLVLGNCVKTAKHSRGSGVIEDRADIVYEIRDATSFEPKGTKPWVEELPPADAASWAARSSRRKLRKVYRLAFIPTKFRLGEEPEPFILEMDLSQEPWTLTDVTDAVDRQGAEARAEREREREEAKMRAVRALLNEIHRRWEAGEAVMFKDKDTVPFLRTQGLTQALAREVLRWGDGTYWRLAKLEQGQGHPVRVFPLSVTEAGINENPHGNTTLAEPAKIAAADDPCFRGTLFMHSTEIDASQARKKCGSQGGDISVAAANDSAPSAPTEVVEI